MTTDITELAHSLKAAANTTADAIDRLKAFPGDELIDLSQHEGEQVDIDIATLNQWYELSSPANILALVEALEKAQGMEAYWKTQCRGITDHCEELQVQIDYLQKIAREQNDLATKASNENASLSVMHGKALKHIDSLEKDLVPVYQFIMNNHHKDGYIEWCDCNKQYYETVNEEERRILYSNVGVELQTIPPVTYFENDDAYQCRKWAWQQVKDEVTTEGWTSGDNVTYFGFFCWGWDMRRQYNEQRPVTVKLPKPHAHLIWIQAGHAPDDYWDDVAVSHCEKDRCCDGSERYPVYARWEIEEMLTAAGIKVEAE